MLAKLISDELSADLEWREAELAILRKQIYGSTPGSISEASLLRAGVAMVYAHYEGFCKFSLEIYLDYLEKLKLTRREVIWPLAALSMNNFKSNIISSSDSKTFFSSFLLDINNELNKVAIYERPPQIANLWPDLLINWLGRLGLGATTAIFNKTLLESLVDKRNHIAHGKKLTVKTRAEFDQYAKAAGLAMHEIAVEIVSALHSKSYKCAPGQQTVVNHAV